MCRQVLFKGEDIEIYNDYTYFDGLIISSSKNRYFAFTEKENGKDVCFIVLENKYPCEAIGKIKLKANSNLYQSIADKIRVFEFKNVVGKRILLKDLNLYMQQRTKSKTNIFDYDKMFWEDFTWIVGYGGFNVKMKILNPQEKDFTKIVVKVKDVIRI